MKNTKGITLIALIVTIIVLIILAGISVNLLFGNNGILNKAKKAVDATELGTFLQEANMAYADIFATKTAQNLGTTVSTAELVAKLINTGYTIHTVSTSGITGITLIPNEVTLVKGIFGRETATLILGTENGANTAYYVEVRNKYYKIEVNSITGKISLGNELNELPDGEITGGVTISPETYNGGLIVTLSTNGTPSIALSLAETSTATAPQTITVSYGGQIATASVIIKNVITGVAITNPPTEIEEEETKTITITSVTPTEGYGDLTWESNSNKLTVTPVANTNGRSVTITGVTKTETNETVTITIKNAKGDVIGTIENLVVKEPRYLAMISEVGDYVDIDLNCSSYTNKWRVLSKTGNTKDDSVKLISASCPIKYYESNGSLDMISDLENMNSIKITKGSGHANQGFRKDSITGTTLENDETEKIVNLLNYFEDNSNGNCYMFINSEEGIHAFGCNSMIDGTVVGSNREFEELYTYITGESKTPGDLYRIENPLKNTNLISVGNANGKNWTNFPRWINIFDGNGDWVLGGSPHNSDRLWIVYGDTRLENWCSGEINLKLVISLQSGVKISGGTGANVSNAYTLTK